MFKSYLTAIKELFPQAWGSKDHVLTKAMGLGIMLSAFKDAVYLCQVHQGGQLTVEAFKNQLKPLIGAKITRLGSEPPT